MDDDLAELLRAIEHEVDRARRLRSGERAYSHKLYIHLCWSSLPEMSERDAAYYKSALQPRGYNEVHVRPLDHFAKHPKPAKGLAVEIESALHTSLGVAFISLSSGDTTYYPSVIILDLIELMLGPSGRPDENTGFVLFEDLAVAL
eukprot:TRINITY_DN6543_c0_g2_i2.p1 TRINITY_DN6543_c0_g2~~TRINITY_DN6543_c0_g2_i2.p1  ORF type:complete len:146 (-),score=24.04 TRINITY_DN6543_c0_g2_i2:25-462(-)